MKHTTNWYLLRDRAERIAIEDALLHALAAIVQIRRVVRSPRSAAEKVGMVNYYLDRFTRTTCIGDEDRNG